MKVKWLELASRGLTIEIENRVSAEWILYFYLHANYDRQVRATAIRVALEYSIKVILLTIGIFAFVTGIILFYSTPPTNNTRHFELFKGRYSKG